MSIFRAWKNSRIIFLGLALFFGLILSFGLLASMAPGHSYAVVLAQSPSTRHVDAATGSDSGNDCSTSATPCATIQHAVDVADAADEIRVATGIYTGVQARAGITQMVYISKTVTVCGGYTTTNWTMSNPISYPTTLDAQEQGRVLYVIGDVSVTIEGLDITGGDVAGLGSGVSGDSGGGVLVISATITMSNNQVFSNTAIFGGGLYFHNSPNAMLTCNIISNNKGWNKGGGLTFNNSPTATLTANTISNNVADDFPGFAQNFCGGVCFYSSSNNAMLIDNTISGNHTANTCGGVCFTASDDATLIGNTIINNTRGPGWDGFGAGVSLNNSKNVSLVANMINNNTGQNIGNLGTILGGGLHIGNNSTATLISNTISLNGATRGGGLNIANSTVVLISDIITGNTVYDSQGPWHYHPGGGGLYLNNSTVTLTNVVIAGNQTETEGSGLYIERSSPRLLHTTIANNSGGDGSGVYITNASNIVLTNTILVSHTVGITVAVGNATLDGVLWYSNTTNTGGDGAITITHAYTGHPVFVAPAMGDYHIGLTSAAIDRGIPANVVGDVDGDPRPQGSGYDLGADETGLVVSKHAYPDPVQAGAQLTYTIRVTNTSDAILHTAITDTLPDQVVPGGTRTWTPTITAHGGVWAETFVVTVELGYAGPLTNVVQVTTEEGATGAYTRTVTAVRTFTVSGTVTCGAGPVAGIEVFVWNRDLGTGFLGDTTGVSGTYSVTLEEGNYDMNFNPICGSGCASRTFKGITGPPDRTLNVSLLPGHSVSGTVFATDGSTPVGNVAIYAFNHDTADGFGLPPTDSAGHYCIGLPEGDYDLGFAPPSCLGLGPKTDSIVVTQVITHNVTLPPGFTVSGCIADEAGNPVPGVQIYAFDPSVGGFGFAPSDESGCYTGTLPQGTFDFQFIPPAGLGLGSITVVDVVSETAGCPNTSLPITLPVGVTLSGAVTCREEPIPNTFAYAAPVEGGAPGDDLVGWGLYTVDNSTYELPIVPGTYRVEFIPPPSARLNAKAFTITEIITDTVIDVEMCVCSGVWISEAVDSEGDVGVGTSLALAPTAPYTPHISYRDITSSNLKHAWLNATAWLSETVGCGGGGSLALVPTYPYTPCISYDGCNRHIEFACKEGTTWTSKTMPGLDKCCSSLALEPIYPYTPHISHFWKWGTCRTLYHTHLSGTTWFSGTWKSEPVEPPNSEVGYESSVAMESTHPYTLHIAYYDHGNYDLKYAWMSGTTWLSETVDSDGNVARGLSLALDNEENPHIGYRDDTNGTLKYAWKKNTSWFSMTVDNTGPSLYSGRQIQLKLDQSDRPYISDYDSATDDLKLTRFNGTVWIVQTVDSEGDVGKFASLALNPIGCPHISYRDATNQDLKYAYVPPLADMAIVKSSPSFTLTTGNKLTYTLTYTNNGPDEAINVVISDTLHPWLTNPSTKTWTSYTGSVPIASDRYVWTIGAVPAGEWGIITITARISSPAGGVFSITNRATITTTTAHVGYVDANPDDNTSIVYNIVDTEPPMTPTLKSPISGTVTNTNAITFTWSDESGSGAASYTLLLNGVPHTVTTPCSATVLSDGNYTWTVRALDNLGNASGYTDTWNLTVDTVSPQVLSVNPINGAVNVGISAPLIITFNEAIITHTFTYTISPDPGGWNEVWNSARTMVTMTHDNFGNKTTYTVTITAAGDLARNPLSGAPYTWHLSTIDGPGLAATKQAYPNPVRAGSQLTYTIRVTNTGSIDLHTTISDTLPTHILPSETPSGTLILPGGTLTWTPTIAAPDGVWTQQFVVTAETCYTGSLTNVIQVTSVEGATGVHTVTTTVTRPTDQCIYLPIILKNYDPLLMGVSGILHAWDMCLVPLSTHARAAR